MSQFWEAVLRVVLDRKYRLRVDYSHVFLQEQVEAQWAQRCPRPLVTQKTRAFLFHAAPDLKGGNGIPSAAGAADLL